MAGESLDPPRWVERHGDYLYRFAPAKVRRGEVAEELVQEALLAACAGRERSAGRATERSWLVAILKRKVVSRLDGREREARRGHVLAT
jgi:RNA polymerase sigma-70 factor (ECF subfamily)